MKRITLFFAAACLLLLTLIAAAFAIYGDIHKDGKVDSIDAVLLAQYLAGWDLELTAQDKENADVHYDGKINAIDAVKLAQYIAGWDVKLGPKGEDIEIDADDLFDGTDGDETTTPAPDTSRPNGSFEMGVNVNGLEDPNNIWKLMTVPGVLKSEKTYIDIKEKGFDHIRLPVPFHSYFDAESEKLDEKKMAVVDTAVDLAIGQGLGVILDFHGWYDFDPESEEHKELFTAIWAVVADRYKEKSELLMFELINEPHYHKNTATLINFELDVVEVIRRTNPARLILIAGPDSNGPWKLPEVNIPNGYENLAMAVHIYEPGDFTHQGCTWAGKEAGKQVRLTAEYLDSLKWNINEVKKFAQRTGIKVMITEVGMNVALAHEEDTDRYVRTLSQYCHDSGTSLAWWSYDGGDFGLYIKGEWREKVLDAIFLK